jgi:hypothetical protein
MQKIISDNLPEESPRLKIRNILLGLAYGLNFLFSALIATDLLRLNSSLLGLSPGFVCLSANLSFYVILSLIGYVFCFRPWSEEFCAK